MLASKIIGKVSVKKKCTLKYEHTISGSSRVLGYTVYRFFFFFLIGYTVYLNCILLILGTQYTML